VNVYVLRGERETARFDFGSNLPQAADDGGGIPMRQHIGQLERLAVGDAALNVVPVQAGRRREKT